MFFFKGESEMVGRRLKYCQSVSTTRTRRQECFLSMEIPFSTQPGHPRVSDMTPLFVSKLTSTMDHRELQTRPGLRRPRDASSVAALGCQRRSTSDPGGVALTRLNDVTRNINSTGKSTAFSAAHDNSVNQMVKGASTGRFTFVDDNFANAVMVVLRIRSGLLLRAFAHAGVIYERKRA